MYDNLKPGDKIAEEKYTVKVDGEVIHYTMTLEKSGAFDYGNGTCMTVHDDYPGTWDQHYDTRYCDGLHKPELFRDWSYEWLKNYLRPDCVIERA